jgi:2-methylcitrate dehydratase PrpD
MKDNQIGYGDIEGIDVEVGRFHTNWMRFDEPNNGDEARFSLKHVMATAILKQDVWVESFTDEAVNNPEYREAWRKVNVILHPEWPSTRDAVQALLTVKLKDGRVFTRTASELREPSRDELTNNYKRLTEPMLSPELQERSLDLMFSIEKTKNISELMSILGLRS